MGHPSTYAKMLNEMRWAIEYGTIEFTSPKRKCFRVTAVKCRRGNCTFSYRV